MRFSLRADLRHRKGKMGQSAKIIFRAPPAFAVPSLEALIDAGHEILTVVTQPDRPKGRGREAAPSAVKAAAMAHSIPVITPTRIREASFAGGLGARPRDSM